MENVGLNDLLDEKHLLLKFVLILIWSVFSIEHGHNEPDLILKSKELTIDPGRKFECSFPTNKDVMQLVRIVGGMDFFDGLTTKKGIGLIELSDEIDFCPVIKDSLFDDFGSVELNLVIVAANNVVESLVF